MPPLGPVGPGHLWVPQEVEGRGRAAQSGCFFFFFLFLGVVVRSYEPSKGCWGGVRVLTPRRRLGSDSGAPAPGGAGLGRGRGSRRAARALGSCGGRGSAWGRGSRRREGGRGRGSRRTRPHAVHVESARALTEHHWRAGAACGAGPCKRGPWREIPRLSTRYDGGSGGTSLPSRYFSLFLLCSRGGAVGERGGQAILGPLETQG